MSTILGVAGVQMEVFPEQGNLERIRDRLAHLREQAPWVELVVFSELCVFGRSPAHAQPLPGPASAQLGALAREFGLWLVPGSIYETAPNGYYNTALVFSPQGNLVASYRKMFPWRPAEGSLPGTEFCVFDMPGRCRVGVCICYDQWFPEVVRQLAWMGAEVVVNPVLTYTADRPLELVMGRANAITNQLYFLSVNGLGHGGNGQSFLVDPQGAMLRECGQEEAVLLARLDLDEVRRVRREGTAGLCHVLRSFRDAPAPFPVYVQGPATSPALRALGPIAGADRPGGQGWSANE